MLTAILIDDEKNSRQSLRKKIGTHCPNIEVVAECSNGIEGIEAIQRYHPQVVFLDIEMPQMNGFSMLQQLPSKDFELIFTTAFNQYAIDAIRFSALDYLVKPVDATELTNAVQRIGTRKKNSIHNEQLDIIASYFSNQKQAPSKIALSVSGGLEIIDMDTIVYLEATSNYTHIHLAAGKPLVASKTLKEFEDILPPNRFCRVHNGSIINIACVKKYNKGEGGQVILSSGAILDVARRRKDELLQLLHKVAAKI